MAVVLTGSEHVEVADSASIRSPSTAITLAAWVLPPGTDRTGGFPGVALKPIDTGNDPFLSYGIVGEDEEDREYYGWVSDGVPGEFGYSGAMGAVTADQWVHLCASWSDGNTLRIEARATDGTLLDSSTVGSIDGPIGYDGASLFFGQDPNGATLIGQMAGVYLHNAELTAQQREDLALDTVAVTTGGEGTPSISASGGYWPLDYDARDISGNGNDGTTSGDPDFTEEPPGDTDLDGTDATQAQSATAAVLTQTHGLSASDATQVQSATAAALTQIHELQPTSAVQGQAATAPALAQTHELTAASVAQAQTADAAALLGDVLINLDFVALAPVFRERVATAPQFRQRVATNPELGHGDAGEPTFAARTAGEPVSAHGQPTTPEFKPRTALQPAFAHGDPGEPTT